jgi:hypothetical protein
VHSVEFHDVTQDQIALVVGVSIRAASHTMVRACLGMTTYFSRGVALKKTGKKVAGGKKEGEQRGRTFQEFQIRVCEEVDVHAVALPLQRRHEHLQKYLELFEVARFFSNVFHV